MVGLRNRSIAFQLCGANAVGGGIPGKMAGIIAIADHHEVLAPQPCVPQHPAVMQPVIEQRKDRPERDEKAEPPRAFKKGIATSVFEVLPR